MIWLTICIVIAFIAQVRGDFGLLVVRPTPVPRASVQDGSTERSFCISFNPNFHHLPTELSKAVLHNFMDLSGDYGCNGTEYNQTSGSFVDSAVSVARGVCPFAQKARLAQAFGAMALLIVDKALVLPGANNVSDYNEINITVASLRWDDLYQIEAMGKHVKIRMYAPEVLVTFEPSQIIMFVIAVVCVTVGGYWSGVDKTSKKQKSRKRRQSGSKSVQSTDSADEEEEEEGADISLPVVVVFFILICTFLVCLYFFYDYLVYVVIGIFCIAGSSGLYYCILPLWNRVIPWHSRLPANKVPCFSDRPEVRGLLLAALCLAVGVFWVVERHASYAWILQDLLGLVFCINMLKTVHMPSLKVCSILLTLLFVYDVFFVFITPFFTKSGDSIMVDVATGSKSSTGEQLPMVFKVPHLSQTPLSMCPTSYSLLGFGDIIVPGLLIAYNHAFDLKVQSSRVYFIATTIAYAVGLVVTFVVLYFMETGQPALLYLVPCILLTTVAIGFKRGELKHLWSGSKINSAKKTDVTVAPHIAEPPVPGHPVPQSVSVEVGSVCSNSSTDSEGRSLLH